MNTVLSCPVGPLLSLFSHHCHYHHHRHHHHCDQPDRRRVNICHFHPPNTSPFSLIFLREWPLGFERTWINWFFKDVEEVFFFFRWNSYNIKLTVLQWSVQWYLGHLHVVQPSPLSSCKTFSSLPKETLYPVSSHLPFFPSPWPLATTDLLSISIDEHVWIFIWMESYSIWLFISVFTCHKILAVYSSCGM